MAFGLIAFAQPLYFTAQAAELDSLQTVSHSAAVVNNEPQHTNIIGWSKLTRRDHKIEVRLGTSELPSGIYTVWWNIVYFPGQSNQSWSYIRAGAQLVQADGKLVVQAVLKEGQHEPNVSVNHVGPGLLDPQGAHITFLIRDHGPVSNDTVVQAAQLTSLNGGCRSPYDHISTGHQCINVQSASHPAIATDGHDALHQTAAVYAITEIGLQ